MLPVFRSSGMKINYVESRDGHSWEPWRDHLGHGLCWLFPGDSRGLGLAKDPFSGVSPHTAAYEFGISGFWLHSWLRAEKGDPDKSILTRQ